MNETEYRAELRRMGFVASGLKTGIAERWDHIRGRSAWLTDPKYLNEASMEVAIKSVKRSLGLT